MAFTVTLSKDRAKNGLAPCSSVIESGMWDDQPWEVKLQYCRACPFRFAYQPTCNLDLLTFSEVEEFKHDLSIALSWIQSDPGNRFFDRTYREIEQAYHLIASPVPNPKKIIHDFLVDYPHPDKKIAEAFRAEWNTIVEGYEGKPFRIEGAEDTKGVAGRIIESWMNPIKYSGRSLYRLYAAFSVLEAASEFLNLPRLLEASKRLVEACRRAVTAHASLEIS